MLLCNAIVVGIVVLLVMVDVRTGHGYALAALSSLHLVVTAVVVGTIFIAAQEQPKPITRQNGSPAVLLVFYFVPAIYTMVAIVIGAAIVAGIARRWLWIVGFIAAAAIPLPVGVMPYLLQSLNPDEYTVQNVAFLLVLVAPMATVLAYGITRIVHPVTRVVAHQPAPLT